MVRKYFALPAVLLLLVATSCLSPAKRNKIFADGITAAFFDTKMAAQYQAYVTADLTLGENIKDKRLDWVTRIEVLVQAEAHEGGIVAAIKVYMLTNGICDQYEAYVDADPNLGEQSKYIRKRSAAQIRRLIATAEGD